MSALVNFLSGEFFLKSRPNGGTAVLLRSLWVTSLICFCALPAKSYLAEGTELAFSGAQLKVELGEMIPWFGAVFAGAYAAFYSRFAAQWSYLATLYNQLMAACAASPSGMISNQTMVNWHAAFVEDAQWRNGVRFTYAPIAFVDSSGYSRNQAPNTPLWVKRRSSNCFDSWMT